ncbi:hypothetical protein P171DRAFT_430843 [Karstenula rhodostoma CBS 690.94]|uniref:Uncharacterized protein n=1 Tax=Karstenula rhodostoma CBS 690.94 TaxID=1392251 RepID=A0A9P4UDI4_9PLEO|nr:hypothetical protein P171DRAFT_430843 [Karstenula rhodostoma CBS 690.94]
MRLLSCPSIQHEELAESTLSEARSHCTFLLHTWENVEDTYQGPISHKDLSWKEGFGDTLTPTQSIQLRPGFDHPSDIMSSQACRVLKHIVAVTVGVLCTALLSDYSTFQRRGGGSFDSFFGSYLPSKEMTLFLYRGYAASHRQDPTKPWYAERPSLLFREPSPELLVAAVVAYHLALRRLHVALTSRSKFHTHILVIGWLLALLWAYIGAFDMLDTALVIMPVAVNISLFLSYLAGLRWAAAVSIRSGGDELSKNSMTKGNAALSSVC